MSAVTATNTYSYWGGRFLMLASTCLLHTDYFSNVNGILGNSYNKV